MKYTALEILTAAGIENPKEQFGKVGINIAGVTVNTPRHVVNMQDAKTASIVVAKKPYEVTLPAIKKEEGDRRGTESAGVKAALKAKGQKSTEAFEKQQIAKGRIKAPEKPAEA